MPKEEAKKEEIVDDKKEEESKDTTKEEEKPLTPDEIFEAQFGELIAEEDKAEEKPPEELEEEPKEKDKTSDDGKESSEEETIEGKEEAKPKPDEKVQQETEHKEEEPPAKAPKKEKVEQEVKEEKQEKIQEETKDFDPNVLFEGLENDVTEKELVDFAGEMDTNAKYAQEIAKIVGKRIVDYTNQSFKTLIEKLTPYLQATVKQIEKEHASSVRLRHQDFDDLKENSDVEAWIKEKPKYRQKSMMETFKNGDSEDIADLLDDYKKDRGLIKPVKEEEDPVKANNKKKIKDKIDNLSVVKTKASPVHLSQEAINQEDFEGTFDKIASSKH
jgi:hypothetical protein